MRVYKINTNLTDKQNKELIKNMSDEDANFFTSLDIKASVDLLDENENITSVMVTNVINLEKLKTYFTNKNIEFTVDDITEYFSQEEDDDKLNEILEDITTEDILKLFGIEI